MPEFAVTGHVIVEAESVEAAGALLRALSRGEGDPVRVTDEITFHIDGGVDPEEIFDPDADESPGPDHSCEGGCRWPKCRCEEGEPLNGDSTLEPQTGTSAQIEYGRNFREAMERIEALPPSERAAASNRSSSSTPPRTSGGAS